MASKKRNIKKVHCCNHNKCNCKNENKNSENNDYINIDPVNIDSVNSVTCEMSPPLSPQDKANIKNTKINIKSTKNKVNRFGEIYAVLGFLASRWKYYDLPESTKPEYIFENRKFYQLAKEFLLYVFGTSLDIREDIEYVMKFIDFKLLQPRPMFSNELHTSLELFSIFKKEGLNYVIIMKGCCFKCKKDDNLKTRKRKVFVFDDRHKESIGLPSTYYYKVCTKCDIKYHLGYMVKDKSVNAQIYCYPNRHKGEFWYHRFKEGSRNFFSIHTIKRWGVANHVASMPFYSMESIYNSNHGNDHFLKSGKIVEYLMKKKKIKRKKRTKKESFCSVDRRKIEDVFLDYNTHILCMKYGGDVIDELLQYKAHKTSSQWRYSIISYLIWSFIKYWCNHECKWPGCREHVILDGHHKARCLLCANKWFHALIRGLMKIPIGCVKSPATGKDGYCKRCTNLRKYFDNPLIQKQCLEKYEQNVLSNQQNEYFIEKIIGKKKIGTRMFYAIKWYGWRLRGRYNSPTRGPNTPYDEWTSAQLIASKWKKMFNQRNNIGYNELREDNDYKPVNIFDFNDYYDLLWDGHPLNGKETYEEGVCKGINKEDPSDKNKKIDEAEKKDIKRKRTAGIATLMSPCMMIIGFFPMFRCESLSLIWHFLIEWIKKCNIAQTRPNLHLWYYDACHLKIFVENVERIQKAGDIEDIEAAKFLARIKKLIDKFHYQGHTIECQKKFEKEIKDEMYKYINSQACEAFFKKLAQHKIITLNMNYQNYIVYMLALFDKHNVAMQETLKKSGFNPHFREH